MGLNTAVAFALCGAALLLARCGTPAARAFVMAAGLAVLMLALATLLQPLHGLHARGLGQQFLLNADPPDGPWPGRMRPGAAFAFALAGIGLMLLPCLAGRTAALVPLLGALVAAVALPSLFSNMLGNVLFDHEGPGGALLPVPTALGVMAVGCALCQARASSAWPGVFAGREDRRIFVTSFALFSVLSLVASVVGVGIVGRYAMENFQNAWLTSFRSNAELFRSAIENAAKDGGEVARLVEMQPLAAQGASPVQLQEELARLARRALGDASNLALLGPDGSVIASAGTMRYTGQFSMALPLPLSPRLYWSGGWHLLTDIAQGGGRRVRVDVELASFNRHFTGMNGAASTGEARVCAATGNTMHCFPSRLQPAPTVMPMAARGQRLPSQLALEGEPGVATTRDYRGAEVLAAYGMIEGTGLGLVQKVDTEEFFRPLRKQLLAALAGIALLILAGALLLQWRTQPLVLGLVRTRARLDAILDNVPAGVLTFDPFGAIQSANRAACDMFGYSPQQMAGRPVQPLVEGGQYLLGADIRGARQLTGRRSNGEALALEVVASEFMLGEHRRRIAIVRDVGKRVRMEQALRMREASLAHAQQLAHIGSWELDLASGSHYWSDETFRIFGRAPGGAPPGHEAVMQCVHPDDRPHKRQAEIDAIAGRRPYDVTFRLVLPGGDVKVVHSRAETEFDGAGGALRLRGTLQDITEKTWADEQLRKREEEYRALVENSPDVVIRFDRALRCVYANPALAKAPGLHPVIGYARVLGDGDKRAAVPWARAVRKALAGGKPDAFEVAVDADGALCHYQVQVVPEVRQGGVVAAVVATARDITAIRSGEAVLRESERRLAGIAANTPGAVFQCVASGGELSFTYLSEGIVPLFGQAPAAVLADAARLTARISPEDRPGFFASLERSARTLKMLNWEGRAFSGDDRAIWVNCRATPRMAGAATVWEGLMLNITDSKRNEQQLTESRQLLRELSAHSERGREEERKKIAREVHDELGQALTALRMDVALLRMTEGPHSEALLARMQSMKEAVDRTIGIVRHVTSALRPAALDVGLTAALEWQAEEFTQRSGIECVLHAIDEVELGDSQATALFRIVQESLTNVLKHAQATHVEVALEAQDNVIRLEISDNGRGFLAGGRLERGRFGLMGMRERALMLGGRVEINSAPGHGTTIQVSLPHTGPDGARAPNMEQRHDG